MPEIRLVNIPIDNDTFKKYQDDLLFETPSNKPDLNLYDHTYRDGVNVNLMLYTAHGAFIKVSITDTVRHYGTEFSMHSLCEKKQANFNGRAYEINLMPIN